MNLNLLNRFRRSITRSITRQLGITRLRKSDAEISIKTILVCRPNHRLGNLVMITPLLQELWYSFPHAKVDLFVKGTVAPELFRNYHNISRIILLPKRPQNAIMKYFEGWAAIRRKRYDLVINAIHSSSSGKMSTQFAKGRFKLLGEINDDIRASNSDYHHMAKISVYSVRYFLNMLGLKSQDRPVAPLDLKLTEAEIADGRRLLRELLHNDKPAIGIYTYATGQKSYSPTWWHECFALLKERFPDHNILEVLPLENVSQIAFHAPSFYSKNLRQIASVIANLSVFIAADSGMMHLASASRTNVIGLFKANNTHQYAPYNDKSAAMHTDHASQHDIVQLVGEIIVANQPAGELTRK